MRPEDRLLTLGLALRTPEFGRSFGSAVRDTHQFEKKETVWHSVAKQPTLVRKWKKSMT